MANENLEEEVEVWLKKILGREDTARISIKIESKNEKGAGYIGDVLFVEATKTPKDGAPERISLALKCSKKSKALRESTPMREIFGNEIHMYETVIPAFQNFQQERGLPAFRAVPKHYGSLVAQDMEIIALENLRSSGFSLWDKRKPLPRGHLELVARQYGQFHAISAVLNAENPHLLEELAGRLEPVLQQMLERTSFSEVVWKRIDEASELLKDELDEDTLRAWRGFKQETGYLFSKQFEEEARFRVITHGDCWGNNFMYKHKVVDGKLLAEDVKLLDWQISKYSSPICDLSYFLFASISHEDLEDLEAILKHYHLSFSESVKKLGGDPAKLYPYEAFKSDWKKYAKYGITMAPMVYYVCSTETEEVLDLGEMADNGGDFAKTFNYEIKDNGIFKSRMKTLIPFVVGNKLI